MDAKNVPRSFSALLVLETGGAPFCGCLYLLPQYRVALDLRQGLALFHRSGDPGGVGLHANSGLHLPAPDSHRVALVLYLTRIGDAAAAQAQAEAEAGAAGGGAGKGAGGGGGGE